MNDFYQKYDIYCKNHTKKKISLKNVAKCDLRKKNWCEKHFSTLFLVAKRGGVCPKSQLTVSRGGGRKLPNLGSADIWMTPKGVEKQQQNVAMERRV